MPVLFKLVKLGYGDLETVKKLDARTVIQALYYEDFNSNYQEAWVEMNKDANR